MEIMIENQTMVRMRLPYAQEDVEALGVYVELLPKSEGAAARTLIEKPVWNRMRLEAPIVQDWLTRNKLRVL